MSAVMSRPLADDTSAECSVDELDAAIGKLVRQMNADSYRMLVLVPGRKARRGERSKRMPWSPS